MANILQFFGISSRKAPVNLAAKPVATATGKAGKRSVKAIIKKLPKREVSYQIEDIKSALTMAANVDTPDRYKLFQIFNYIMKDGHLKSQIRVAKYKVLSEPWQIYQGKVVDVATSDLLLKRWVNTIIEYILEAELYGFTCIEMDMIDPANWAIGEVAIVPRDYISIEKQWILVEGSVNGSVLPYADIMNELEMLEFGRRDDYGTLLECAYNIIWKFYSRSDWSRGSEKFGMPILIVEADTNNDAELDAIETKAANFGTDGYMVVQAGDKATLMERKGDKMHDIWKDNILLCNEEVSKIINGQTGSSDPKAFVGAANVQERTMEDFTMARLQNVVDEFNEKVIPYLIAKGFAIKEGSRLDYPSLIRDRERKLTGPIPIIDPAAPAPDPAKPTPDPKKPVPVPKPVK